MGGCVLLLLPLIGLLESPALLGGLVWAFVFINVLEAVLAELNMWRSAGVGRVWNALFGLGVALSFPFHAAEITADAVLYDVPLWWVAAYTVWNFLFVTHSTEGRLSMHHVAVLGVPLVWAWVDPAMWVHARVFVLGLYLVLFNTFFPTFRLRFRAPVWRPGRPKPG